MLRPSLSMISPVGPVPERRALGGVAGACPALHQSERRTVIRPQQQNVSGLVLWNTTSFYLQAGLLARRGDARFLGQDRCRLRGAARRFGGPPCGELGQLGVAAHDARQVARMPEKYGKDSRNAQRLDPVPGTRDAQGPDECLIQTEHRAGYGGSLRIALAEGGGVHRLADLIVLVAGEAAEGEDDVPCRA